MKNSSGWRVVCGYDVYVENNKILRGVSGGRVTYPYRWDSDLNAYIYCSGISVSAFRSAYYRNTVTMM